MNSTPSRACVPGFTLIELIITLCLMGAVGAMIMPFFLSGATTSTTPLFRLQDNVELEAVLENIIADAQRRVGGKSLGWADICLNGDSLYNRLTGSFNATYNPAGYPVTVAVTPADCSACTPAGTGHTGTSALGPGDFSPPLGFAYDQNCAMLVTLTHGNTGQAMSYLFVNGDNY